MAPSKIEIDCDECGAVFEVRHFMDSTRFQVSACVFCGSEIETEISCFDDEDFIGSDQETDY